MFFVATVLYFALIEAGGMLDELNFRIFRECGNLSYRIRLFGVG